MIETKLVGMQRDAPGEGLAATIFPVAENRATDGRQLGTDLMLASGQKFHFDDRSVLILADDAIVKYGLFCRRICRLGGGCFDRLHFAKRIVFYQPVRELTAGLPEIIFG